MTQAILDRPASLFDGEAVQPAGGRFRRPLAGGRGVTLEERLSSALHATRTNGGTECPVCDERMTRAAGGGAECGGCGARLS